MNPFDNVGTTRVSISIYDRLCRLAIGYQTDAEEREIVARRTGSANLRLIQAAVQIGRATREHPQLRSGASVRGAIDFVLLAEQFALLNGANLESESGLNAVAGDAARLAFSSKIVVREPSDLSPERILTDIVGQTVNHAG
jgi:MoxR-like ATPase